MVYKLIFVLAGLVCLNFQSTAQIYLENALDLNTNNSGYSARFQGIGGVSTALGGDPASTTFNPAGLGFYNKSEFYFSPGFDFSSSTIDFLDNSNSEQKINLNFQNLGVVLNQSKSDIEQGGWRGGSFGIGFSRTGNFNNEISFNGLNNSTDFIDVVLDKTYTGNEDVFTNLAFNTFLTEEFFVVYEGQDVININGVPQDINDIFGDNLNFGDSLFFIDRNIFAFENGQFVTDADGNLIPAFPEEGFPTGQFETIRRQGGKYQYNLSYGGNFDDRLYFGASLSYIRVRKEETRTYREEPTAADLLNFELRDEYELTGNGVNGTFGLIYRPALPLMFGLTYTTPTFYFMQEESLISLESNFFDETFFDETLFTFDYNYRSPQRLNGGLTYFFGKSGFISGEIEYVDHSVSEFSNADADPVFESETNNQIDELFEAVINLRIGGEIRIGDLRFRGGYSRMQSPIDDDLSRDVNQISFGGGYRNADYYLDLSYTHQLDRESIVNFTSGLGSGVVNTNQSRFTISTGFFF